MLDELISEMRKRGHTVDSEFPGLYRINGGPELTTYQFVRVATEMLSGMSLGII